MALHGEVKVNEVVIGYYIIHRNEKLESYDQESDYSWSYFEARNEEIYSGRVKHVYNDGAPALIAKVMAEVAKVNSYRPVTAHTNP